MSKKHTLGIYDRPSFPAKLFTAAAALLLAAASPMQAQTYTWTGGSATSSNWSDHLNWSVSPANSNSTPLAGLSSGLYLVFPARTSYGKTVATNDITGITGIDGIAFQTTNGFFTGQPVQTDATPAANLIYFTNANSGGTSNNWGLNTTLNAGTCVYGGNGGNVIAFSGVLSGNGQFYGEGSSMGQQQIYLLNANNTFTGQGTGTWGQYEPVGQDSENGPIEVFSGWLWYTSMATSNNASALGKASSIHTGYTGQIALPGQGWSGSGSPLYIGFIGTTSSTSDAPWGLAYYQTGSGRMLSISNNSPNNSSLTWTGPWTTGWLTGSTQPYTLNLGGTSTGINTVAQSIAINWGGTTLAETMNINGPGAWVFSGQSNGLTGAATFAANANVVIRSNDAWFASSITMSSGGALDLTWNDTNKGTYTGPFYIGTNGIQTLTAGHSGTATGTDIIGSLAIATTNTFASPTKGGTLNVAGTGTVGTLTITTNLSDGPNSTSTSNVTFVPSGGAIYMDFGTNNTVGAGSNDLIVVNGNLDLSKGICQITPNVLYPSVSNSITEPAGLEGNVSYTLITYTGTLKPHASGSTGINVALPAGYSAVTVATNVAGSVTVTFTAGKITPTVTAWPTASAITYGQTLASSTLSGGTASVGGTFAWTTPSTQPGAGNPSESVTFTPTDTTDYNDVVGSVNVTVNKATPTVTTWPTASAITYGQTLASSTLSGGTASVGGAFAWTTPGTQPGLGTSGQSVTFTPTDTTDYNTVSGLVSVTVNKATPTVTTWPTASVIGYGQTLASSILSGGSASVGGAFAWTTPGTQPAIGTDAESVTFTPTDTTDYNSVVGSVNVTVSPFAQINMQDGGYLTGVIAHSSGRIVCRTDGGGIYSSDTQGTSWTYLSGNMTTFASLTPQGIAVPQSAGSSSNLILQAVGYSNGGTDPGRGVWKTTDGGVTWTQTLTGVNFLGNGNEREGGECIIFNPGNDSEAWVGTDNSGVWVSEDAGSSWTQDSTAPAMTNSSLYISPSHTSQLFAGGDGGLWVRTNSSATWTHLNTYSLVYRVTGGADGTIYYCGMNGSSQLIQKITATDWTKTSTYTVTDLHSAYTSGIGDDGKALLTATVLKDGRLVVSDAENYTRISANQGTSFTTLSFTYAPGIPIPQWANQSTFSWRCTSLVQDPIHTNNWYGGAGYGPLCTTNSGTNWQYIPNGIGEVVAFKIGFHPTDTNRIYIPCADLGGAVVTDAGLSGNTVSMLHQFFTSDVIQCSHRAMSCKTNGYNRVIFAGWEEINTQPRIYTTINDGTSWYKPTCTGLPTSVNGAEIMDAMDSLDNPDDFLVICGGSSGAGKGGVYRTVNAGTNFSQCNWYPTNSINLSSHWDMFLDRDATNVNIRYMFSSVAYPSGNANTNNGGGFFISYDRGQDWTQLTGFTGGVIPNDWSDWIGKMSADHGISGSVWIALETSPTSCCHDGLAYSSNYGTNFSAVGSFTNAVAVDALNGNVVVLGQMTGDTWNKVYYSTNTGANWSEITATNYAFGNATDVTLDPHWAGRIWITTQERSVGVYYP